LRELLSTNELKNPACPLQVRQITLLRTSCDLVKSANCGWLEARFRRIVFRENNVNLDFNSIVAALHPALALLALANGRRAAARCHV
jgi:hypothetical protein